MTEGILGKKLGMTQMYGKGGKSEAITAIEAGPCTVTQVKTADNDGYSAVQLGFGTRRVKTVEGKPPKKAGFRYLREFHVADMGETKIGDQVDVSLFKEGDLVDVRGVSKGKGFAGGVKRYHFAGGPKTHGQSDRHRHPGAIGSTTTPGRVLKGTRMAGHMGDERVTVRKLEIIKSDPERNLLLVKGALPGSRNGLLLIKKSTGEK